MDLMPLPCPVEPIENDATPVIYTVINCKLRVFENRVLRRIF
jgi:hypothetical protein